MKLYASRPMCTNVQEKFENVFKRIILSRSQRETMYTLSMDLTTYVNYQKNLKYAKIAFIA
jgi:hypothetical protein